MKKLNKNLWMDKDCLVQKIDGFYQVIDSANKDMIGLKAKTQDELHKLINL